MKPKIGFIVFLSFLGGLLGRLGGKKDWNTKFRDIGVSACICAILGYLGRSLGLTPLLSLIPAFFLQFAALTTYRYGLPKPKNYGAGYYALHGFMTALAAFPFAWIRGKWVGFTIRAVLCGFLCGLWYFVAHKNDNLHEGGRYFIITATTPLLLI